MTTGRLKRVERIPTWAAVLGGAIAGAITGSAVALVVVQTGDLPTLAVAVATFVLAAVTYRQVRLSRLSLQLAIRPLLADPRPATRDSDPENVIFGVPGRTAVEVPHGEFFCRLEPSGVFRLSVAFDNIGAGVAAITGAETKPAVGGEIRVSRHFVPVDGTVRVSISIQTSEPEGERFRDQMWAVKEPVEVLIHYTDANGQQAMTSRALIAQAATRAPWIREIAVFRAGESTPIATGGSIKTSNLWLR